MYSSAFSSEDEVKFIFEDNAGRNDTAIIGIDVNSTLGIDNELGENDLYGTSYDSLDVRIIQRDSLHHNCIGEDPYSHYSSPDLYFPENIDLKIDFRPFLHFGENGFSTVNNNFEIYVSATDYPVTVYGDFSKLTYYDHWSNIHLLNESCDPVEKRKMHSSAPVSEILFVLNDSTFTTLIARFEYEVSVEENQIELPEMKIFPNPANNHIVISGLRNINSKIEIVDVFGRELKSIATTGNDKRDINISGFLPGLYLLRLLDENRNCIEVRKFIKE